MQKMETDSNCIESLVNNNFVRLENKNKLEHASLFAQRAEGALFSPNLSDV